MSKALIIIDIQNDFCEGGSTQVRGANEMIPLINTLKKDQQFSLVIITQDWHPKNHVSFAQTHGLKPFASIIVDGKKQQLWLKHCIAGTYGAELSPILEISGKQIIVKKGIYSHVDSYSGFFKDNKEILLKKVLQEHSIKQIIVCGLTFDFCVANTALDAKKYGFDVTIIKEVTLSVNKNTQILMTEKLKQNKVNIISLNDFYSK